MSVEIHGASDDLIEVEGDIREEFNPQNDDPSILAFSDGTVLSIAFDPDGSGNWRITPLAHGTAALSIVQTANEDDTDRASLAGDIRWVVHGTSWAKR